jgi:predicted transposase YdaD
LLVSWKVRIDLGEIGNFSGQEALMALSEVFLEWEQQTKERLRLEERRAIARNMLQDDLPLEQISRLTGLVIADIQALQSHN